MAADLTDRIVYALRRPDTAAAAAEALRGRTGKAVVEGLVELLGSDPAARAGVAAVAALREHDEPIAVDALLQALESPHASVRAAAVAALQERGVTRGEDSLIRILTRDDSWTTRRAALLALAEHAEPGRWQILAASTDPHWRVRHALIGVLLRWGETEAGRREVDERLACAGEDSRTQGLRRYLRYRWTTDPAQPVPPGPPEDPTLACPFWDWDAAVLARNLERLGPQGRRQNLDRMPFLLGHADGRVRGLAAEALRLWGEPRHLAEAIRVLDEVRSEAGSSAAKLLDSLDLDREEALARFILHLPDPSPAQLVYALTRADVARYEGEQSVLLGWLRQAPSQPSNVREALARLAAEWPHPDAVGWLRSFLRDPHPDVQQAALRGLNAREGVEGDRVILLPLLGSPDVRVRVEAVRALLRGGGDRGAIEAAAKDADSRVRAALATCLVEDKAAPDDPVLAGLRSDPHPHVRAAALTPASAAELIRDPARDTSWHVRSRAARIVKVPLWKLEPEEPWQPDESRPSVPSDLRPARTIHPAARPLGRGGPLVAPVGISGHYGLPVEGFVRAVEAGVNLLFWEPNYQTLTEFSAHLSAGDRNALHFIAGTFEAEGKRIERDAERALRLLKVDRLALFLLFWTQSWGRITPDVRESLERLKAAGKVAAFSLSTHSRPLAVEAMEAGWDPVMVRHSAAHRGAEEHVFPRALERGTSIITFNNTCYGRLLQARGSLPAPGAADCYRYTLSQPAVTVCLSAPATLEQLDENLAALRDPYLSPERREHLLACGELTYQEDAVFRKLVRSL